MFKLAIKTTLEYIRPIITGKVKYESKTIENHIASLIILNDKGDILTTASIADLFLLSEDIKDIYPNILNEIKNSNKKKAKKLEEKYGITSDTIIALHNTIIDAYKINGKLNIIKHPYLDLAIIKCKNIEESYVNKFPVFNKECDVGQSICTIGFAFPEYDAFSYDKETNSIITHNKIMNFPIFPQEGMITRNIIDRKNNVSMFEISTKYINGQTGGVIVNPKGEILGLLVGNKRININQTDTIDLSFAINSKTIIEFLNNNEINVNII